MQLFLACLAVCAAKIVEISVQSVKTVCMVKGERKLAAFLGFIECLVWGFVISAVISSLSRNVLLLLAYSIGYSSGLVLGSVIESKLALGTSSIQIMVDKENMEKVEKYLKLEEDLKYYKEKLTKIEERKANKEPYKVIIEKNKNVKWLIVIMLIFILTGFLTPIGDIPFTYYLRTSQGNTMEHISEHLPLTLAEHIDVVSMILIYLAILIFTDCKMTLRDLFMLGGLVLLMFMTRRQVSMMALITCIILNRLITYVFEKHDKGGIERFENMMVKVPGMLITICFVVVLSSYFIEPKLDDEFVSKSSYPVDACDYILENLDVKNMKIYNDYNYGSYLLYRGIPVYVDSRCDLYTPEFNEGVDIFTEYIDISGLNVDYTFKFEEHGITHVMVYANSKLSSAIEKRTDTKYKRIYSDAYFELYEINM